MSATPADTPPLRTDLDDYREAQARAEQDAAERRTLLGLATSHGNEAAGSR
ncbi:hypothetical protein ACMA1D_02025 [Streptomyces sp. 796.1]|uniref:hypothetical protein n=1 Tax=Streptomyces sp. 796.1 TaxID=3163029 RepID=UPI0039C8F23E